MSTSIRSVVCSLFLNLFVFYVVLKRQCDPVLSLTAYTLLLCHFSVLVRLSIPDALFLASIVYQENRVKLYQVLIQFPSVDFDLKQPPVIIQKVVHLHLPTFRALYKNIQPFLNEAPKLPAK